VRFVIGVVGRPKHAGLAAAIEDYEARAARYWPFEAVDVREETARGVPVDAVKEREGERLLARVPVGAQIVACDVGGEEMTSERFARWMQEARERGRDVAILIGGAFGLADAVRSRAALRLSLAPWTLPHELARLVLAEQIYRAGTLVRGEPYHK
jgi:23S rRNA (pseudouridine1915-N3)-methyltransferase